LTTSSSLPKISRKSTLPIRTLPDLNLYRHVECQGVPVDRKNEEESPNNPRAPGKTPYQRIYDVYSLGVILLELGLGRPAIMVQRRAESKSEYGKHSTSRFTERMLEREVPRLKERMDKIDHDVVELCLCSKFETSPDRELSLAVYLDVVYQMDKCRGWISRGIHRCLLLP
jgi:hypothetical protein